MKANAGNSWLGVGLDAWLLGAEASLVAGMRLARISAGGTAGATEARLMVSEKIAAVLELQVDALSGRLGSTPLSTSRATVRHYRSKVSANHRRLSKPK